MEETDEERHTHTFYLTTRESSKVFYANETLCDDVVVILVKAGTDTVKLWTV